MPRLAGSYFMVHPATTLRSDYLSSQLTTASEMTLKLLDFRSKTQKYSDNPEFVIHRAVCPSCT